MKSNKTQFKSPSPRANSQRSQLAAANLHFSIHIPIAATLTHFHINATPTRRLLEPSRDDSRQSVQEGLASCFVSDRCSWPTVRHASSCTKAPLCAINHVKPAWSYKSLLWGNPPFQIYKMERGATCLPKCCWNARIDRSQQMRGDLIWCLVDGCHVKFNGRMWMLILAVCV